MSPGTVAMEDGKPPSSSLLDNGDTMQTRFADICEILDLHESLTSQATALFREIKPTLLANMSSVGSGSLEEVERIWFACVLYCVTKLDKSNQSGDRIKLFQILRAASLNAVDFFKEMPQFMLKAGRSLSGMYNSDWEKRLELTELQASVIQLNQLSRFYKRAYQQFFLPSDAVSDQNSATSSSTHYVPDFHRFGWLLFLALRIHAFSHFKDLVTCTNGLVSILAILILHVPKRFRSFSFDDSSIFVKNSNKGVNLLASLCHVYNTSEDDLRRTLESVNKLIEGILKKKPQSASDCSAEILDCINTDGLTYFDGLLDGSLESNVLNLEKDYDNAIDTKGELDERIFVTDEDSSLVSGSLYGGASNICGIQWKLDALDSPAKTITSPCFVHSAASPGNGNIDGKSKMVASTPVSAAMTTSKWLRTVISPLPSKPSVELESFFSLCDVDVASHVAHRANIILEAIFPSNSFGERCISGALQTTNLKDNTWAEERKSEALKLYYRVLESICRAESKMQNGNNLPSLLTNERFHRCMLACSAELVLATHHTVIMIFPAVLERTGITAFDLSKVIETFVRHEETLPRELKRHLNGMEERLLESMAWQKGSSMYNSLIIARPALSAEIDCLGLLAEPMTSLDAIAMHQSPGLLLPPFQKLEASPDMNGDPRSPKRLCTENKNMLGERNALTPVKDRLFSTPKSKLHLLQSAFASPARPNPAGGGTYADTEINVFFRKILKLVAIRIKTLCERLKCTDQFLENVYWLIQQILSQRTALFFNRHIDQIILCSIYGVAKVTHTNLTFKEIINYYRKQPQCRPQVIRSVFVNNRNGKMGNDHVDIIRFYNEVFVPCVKLLLEVVPDGITLKNKLNEGKNDCDGQIPVSPRLQPFPTLPDMSPRKVSTSHNVFVSPLRQSKKDALMSPSSKSYYACVGESTHAYQSPSKDLTAINNRLNCGRKVSGRLSFDVVSDSVVAGSLGQQNGSCASSAAAANLTLPPKSEQPDG